MADSFQLKAIITAVDQLSGPLKGMQRQLKGFEKEISGLGLGAGVAGSAILGSLAGATASAMDLENHMADARKAIHELHDPKAFQQMTDQIVDMSTRLPMAADGIAAIVAEAGNAGIPFTELTTFAEDATKAAVGFGMSAEEAGHQLAVWRTSFKLTQKEVMTLSDQMNYLAMTGPTTEKQIGAVVTSVGNLATTAGVSTRDLAAIAATITGVGVDADVAGTGVQNFMLGLTNANTSKAKTVLKAIGMTSAQVAAGMQKDSRGTMLKVLEGIKGISSDKQAKALTWLFGKESIKAIAPLLTNLDLLRKNFDAVSDASKYAGATQREYDSRVNTTEKQLQILKNQFMALSITVGSEFLPLVVRATKAMAPWLSEVLQFIRHNPELVKSVAKFGLALSAVAGAMGGVSRAMKIMNAAFTLSPAKLLVGTLVLGAYEIIEHWDDVAPVIKEVWQEVDRVARAMGGWETVIGGVGLYMTGAFTVKTIGSLKTALMLAKDLSGVLGKIAAMGVTTIQIAVAIYMFEKLKEIAEATKQADHTDSFWQSLKNRWGSGGWYNNQKNREMIKQDTQGDFKPSVPLNKPSVLDRAVAPGTQRSELKVSFENAPQGMRVADIPSSGNPLMNISHDVGYSPFKLPR